MPRIWEIHYFRIRRTKLQVTDSCAGSNELKQHFFLNYSSFSPLTPSFCHISNLHIGPRKYMKENSGGFCKMLPWVIDIFGTSPIPRLTLQSRIGLRTNFHLPANQPKRPSQFSSPRWAMSNDYQLQPPAGAAGRSWGLCEGELIRLNHGRLHHDLALPWPCGVSVLPGLCGDPISRHTFTHGSTITCGERDVRVI